MPGSLIIIDGPSGSGKDSLIAALFKRLSNSQVYVVDEEVLDRDRRYEIITAKDRGKARGGSGDREMAAVLIAHRARVYRDHLIPRLKDGRTVIANRGEPATLAYQTARGELTMDDVWNMHRRIGIPTPDLVVLTTCSPRTAIMREQGDKTAPSIRTEKESGRGLSGKVTQEAGASETEKLARRELIHAQYETAQRFLKRKRVPVLSLNTEKMTVSAEVEAVVELLGRK